MSPGKRERTGLAPRTNNSANPGLPLHKIRLSELNKKATPSGNECTHFVTAIPTGSERNQTSLSNRWSQIQKSVNKFCGFFAQIEARNESGKIFEDKVRDAMALYQQESKSAFTMFPLWTILRNAKKWQDAMVDREKRRQKRKADTNR